MKHIYKITNDAENEFLYWDVNFNLALLKKKKELCDTKNYYVISTLSEILKIVWKENENKSTYILF